MIFVFLFNFWNFINMYLGFISFGFSQLFGTVGLYIFFCQTAEIFSHFFFRCSFYPTIFLLSSGTLMVWLLYSLLFSYRSPWLCLFSFNIFFLCLFRFGEFYWYVFKFTDSLLCNFHFTFEFIQWGFFPHKLYFSVL